MPSSIQGSACNMEKGDDVSKTMIQHTHAPKFSIKRKAVGSQNDRFSPSPLSNIFNGRSDYSVVSKEHESHGVEGLSRIITHLTDIDHDDDASDGDFAGSKNHNGYVAVLEEDETTESHNGTIKPKSGVDITMKEIADINSQWIRDSFLEIPSTRHPRNRQALTNVRLLKDSKCERYNWRPASLRYLSTLFIFLVAHQAVYSIMLSLSRKHHGLAKSDPRWDWLFRFGPSFLAVLIKEYCSRISLDYQSIAPYLKLDLSMGSVPLRGGWLSVGITSLLQPTFWKSMISITYFDLGYVGSALIIVQTIILRYGTITTNHSNVEVLTPPVAAVLQALASSSVPSLGTHAWYPNKSIDDNTWDAPWVAGFDSDASRVSEFGFASYVGLLPFRLSNQSDGIDGVKYATSGLAARLVCEQISNFSIEVVSQGGDAWTTILDVSNSDCRLRDEIKDMNFRSAPDFSRGIVGNDTLALWKTLRGREPQNSPCSLQHFIITGPVKPDGLPDNAGDRIDVSTRSGTGWAAVSCKESYWILEDSILTSRSRDSSSTDASSGVLESKAVMLDKSSQISAAISMKRNFLDTDLIYNVGNWFTAQTFWGGDYNRQLRSNLNLESMFRDCKNLQGVLTMFDNPDACAMVQNLRTIWSSLFALSVPLVSLYLPADQWTNRTGEVEISHKAWYVEEGAHAGLVVLTLSILIPLFLSGFMTYPRWFPRRLRPADQNTGLRMNPGSFVGKASLFFDGHIRSQVADLDAMNQDTALDHCRRRIDRNLLLGRLATIKGDDGIKRRTPVIHSRAVSSFILSRYASSHCVLSENLQRLRKLRYGFSFWQTRPSILVGMFCILSVSTVLLLALVVPRLGDPFHFWIQFPEVSDSSEAAAKNRRYQGLLFSFSPTIVILILRYWWGKIDTIFRTMEPFVGLHRLVPGSVCLEYINEVDGIVTIRALKNRHWKLAAITTVSLIIKLALGFAGGLLEENQSVYGHATNVSLSQFWRNGTFAPSDSSFDRFVHQNSLRRAVGGYSSDAGWRNSMYAFPQLNLDQKMYIVIMEGLVGNLSCETVSTNLAFDSFGSVARLESCAGAEWPRFCFFGGQNASSNASAASAALPSATSKCATSYTIQAGDTCDGIAGKVGVNLQDLRTWNSDIDAACSNLQVGNKLCTTSSVSKRDTTIGGCTGWKYVPKETCGNLGFWWLIDAHGQMSTNSSQAGLTSLGRITSLVCKPQFFLEKVNTTIQTYRGEKLITVHNVLGSKQIGSDHWTQQGNQSLDFSEYISKRLESSNFTAQLHQLSGTYYLDEMSLIAAVNSSSITGAFQNETEFARVASLAFSMVVTQAVLVNFTADGNTMLLESDPNHTREVQAFPYIQSAYISAVPFTMITIVLAILTVSAFLAWPSDARRTAQDPSYVMNHVFLFYDSSLIDRVFDSLRRGSDPEKDLAKTTFAYGVFTGAFTGERRLGVEVAEKVTPVEGSTSRFSLPQVLRRRHRYAKVEEENATKSSTEEWHTRLG